MCVIHVTYFMHIFLLLNKDKWSNISNVKDVHWHVCNSQQCHLFWNGWSIFWKTHEKIFATNNL